MDGPRILAVVVLVLGLAGAGLCDSVELRGGDRISGTVEGVRDGRVVVVTAYAGVVKVDPSHVLRVVTNAADRVSATGSGTAGAAYRWRYTLAVDATARAGNTRDYRAAGSVEAVLAGPKIDLKLYGKGARGETDQLLNESLLLGGVDFERRFRPKQAWYLRDEMLYDEVVGVAYRNMLATGYGHYFLKDDRRELRVRTGLGHTYEIHGGTNRVETAQLALDSGLKFRCTLRDGLVWLTDVTYEPSLADVSSYYLAHESKLELALAARGWANQFGLSHQYVSDPPEDRESLDTLYFMRLRKTW
jgi:hypothetical protein